MKNKRSSSESGPSLLACAPNKIQKSFDCNHALPDIERDENGNFFEPAITKQSDIIAALLKPFLDKRKLGAQRQLPLDTAAKLQTVYKYIETAIIESIADNRKLKAELANAHNENQKLQVKLADSAATNKKLEAELSTLKSAEPMQIGHQDNSAELTVIVLENPTQKPYAEVAKAAKEIFRSINLPKESIDHLRPGPKGKTIVVCTSEQEKAHILESLKTHENLGARVAKERKRALLIKNVPISFKDSELIAEIIANDYRFTAENFTLVRSFKVGGGDRQNIVFNTSEGIYQNLKTHPFVYFDYERYRIVPYISLKQCFSCSGFGHFANTCRAKTKRCPSCSGDHTYKECTANTFKCGLCSKTSSNNITHKATSNVCPLRKKEFYSQARSHVF